VKQTRYTEEHIVGILKEVESGKAIAEVCRQYGVTDQTIYNWKKKFGGMDVSEVKRLRQLETENARLKKIVAQQALDIDALKELLSKKW